MTRTLIQSFQYGLHYYLSITDYHRRMFPGNWSEILPVSYMVEARNRIKVIWLGKPIAIPDQHGIPKYYFVNSNDFLANIFNITRTRTHECIISSDDDWIDFVSDSCYSINCEDGKSWTDVDGKKQSFLDWMTTAKVRSDSKYNFESEKFLDNIVITVFDTTKRKRLIVDVTCSAAALTICSETGISIPDVKVLECYGDKIDVLFPCDAHQL